MPKFQNAEDVPKFQNAENVPEFQVDEDVPKFQVDEDAPQFRVKRRDQHRYRKLTAAMVRDMNASEKSAIKHLFPEHPLLQSHERVRDARERPVDCLRCGASVSRAKHLESHMSSSLCEKRMLKL